MSELSKGVKLPKETIIQLQALSLPGESLASVIQRAALALHTLESQTKTISEDRVTQRLDSLEYRLARLEARSDAFSDSAPSN